VGLLVEKRRKTRDRALTDGVVREDKGGAPCRVSRGYTISRGVDRKKLGASESRDRKVLVVEEKRKGGVRHHPATGKTPERKDLGATINRARLLR